MLANIILLGCLIREFFATREKGRFIYICSILPLFAFGIDFVMIDLGVWNTGLSSEYVFIVFFIVSMVMVLKIIPSNINAAAKAKKLETEKMVLNAQLAESRISTITPLEASSSFVNWIPLKRENLSITLRNICGEILANWTTQSRSECPRKWRMYVIMSALKKCVFRI